MKRRALTVLAAALLAIGLPISSPAYASSVPEVCGNGGSGYCLNDWGNAAGGAVKMEFGGVANDNFILTLVYACNNSDEVSSSCDSQWGAQGHTLDGSLIFEIRYNRQGSPGFGQCVGTNGSGDAVLTACGDAAGKGAGNGAIMAFLDRGSPACGSSTRALYVDRYYSSHYNVLAFLQTGGNPGISAFLNYTDKATATCWGVTT